MKKLDKIILTIFSILIFIKSILLICTILNLIDINILSSIIYKAIIHEEKSKVILIISIVCFICSLKAIFFENNGKEPKVKGILMQNDNGQLLISKNTIENIVISAVKEFNCINDVDVEIDLDSQNNLIVNINLIVDNNVAIKELTVNLQNKVKEALKKTSDLEAKKINVKIKNISNSVEKNKE